MPKFVKGQRAVLALQPLLVRDLIGVIGGAAAGNGDGIVARPGVDAPRARGAREVNDVRVACRTVPGDVDGIPTLNLELDQRPPGSVA